MSIITHSAAATGRTLGFAAVAALVIGAATPSFAAATRTTQAAQPSASTDISAARRQHRAVRSSARDAYGSIGGAAPQSRGYGYGVGDNSRNQTW